MASIPLAMLGCRSKTADERPVRPFNKAGESRGPYAEDGLHQLYEMLFCDIFDHYRTNWGDPPVYPWNILLSEAPREQDLKLVAGDTTLESRQKLLAYHRFSSGQRQGVKQRTPRDNSRDRPG